MARTGFCIHCKGKKNIIEGTLKYASNGKIQERGKCETCGTLISTFVSPKEINKSESEKETNKDDGKGEVKGQEQTNNQS